MHSRASGSGVTPDPVLSPRGRSGPRGP
jgi:hypothetical protein